MQRTPRRARVRNRLLASVALCSVAVLGAGATGIAGASADLSDSQGLVDRATLNRQAIALAHSLADERDDMVEYVAAGRTSADGAGLSDAQRARVDRQIAEVLATGPVPRPVKDSLEEVPDTRQNALSGDGSPYEAFEAYTETIQQLHAISRTVAHGLPGDPDAAAPPVSAVATAEALPHLGRAVEQASATRGLLRGALAADGPQRTLTEAAQQAHVREQAALADFEQTAGTAARDSVDKTVSGADVTLAERYLARLTDSPVLGLSDRALSRERVASALTARVDRMRGVHSSLASAEVKRLEQRRADAVTSLELLIALVAACLLLAAGVSVHTARSVARPLSVLRRGSERLASAADPATQEPVRFTGRNDEFADVVRALNELRGTTLALQERAARAEEGRGALADEKDELAAEREQSRDECLVLRSRLEAVRGASHGTFIHLGLRTLSLVERQLGIVEQLEAEEADPERLATLFKLDHLATRMRRAGENLLLLAGSEHQGSSHSEPVPLLDVLRAAISEIERYERVQLAALPPHAQVSGFAADDLSHLVAELLDNATAFSAPDADVQLSGWMLENGEIMLSVQDEGIGVAPERLAELNERLGEPDLQEPPGAYGPEPGALGMGLYVVARLATRHGLRVQLREQKQGGIAAVVVVPRALLPDRPAPGGAGAHAAQAGPTAGTLPGSVAEANSNALPVRGRSRGEVAAGPAPVPGPRREPEPEAAEEHGPRWERVGDLGVPRQDADDAAEDPAQDAPEPDAEPAEEPAVEDSAADTAGPADEPAEESATEPVEEHTAEPAPRWERVGELRSENEEAGAAPEHARAGDEAPAPQDAEPGGEERRLTGKGLPKRTPRNVATERSPRPRQGGTGAEELRRRLGGFQQGARDGARDAAAEVAAADATSGRGATDEEAGQ